MIRLDVYLTNFGYTKSRQRAKALIEDGCVYLNSQKITKPSFFVDENQINDIKVTDPCPYVSRGGLKLEKMLIDGKIDPTNKLALDIGASTGGFTDCLLKHGARMVYAVDSGTNQLDLALRANERVVCYENYNARDISYSDFETFFDIITIDVSFISQTYILPSAVKLLNENGVYMSLIKPQFEAGREKVGKGGIVKKSKDRLLAVNRVLASAYENELSCVYFSKSPILGGDGNIEYLAIFSKNSNLAISEEYIKKIILEN